MLLTWVIHDAEELHELRQFQPPAPLPMPNRHRLTHMRRAIGVMGLMMVGVTGLGVQSRGQHLLFRAANRANLAHALWHLGASSVAAPPHSGRSRSHAAGVAHCTSNRKGSKKSGPPTATRQGLRLISGCSGRRARRRICAGADICPDMGTQYW